MAHEWGRFVWWAGQNSGAIQALTSIVTVILTAILAYVTYRYVLLTNTLASNSQKQLLLVAHPNPAVETNLHPKSREIRITIANHGAYPFKIENAEVRATGDGGEEFTMELKELHQIVVGANDAAHGREFLHNRNVEFDSGALEDFLVVEFDCEDVLGLVKKRYQYSRILGLREV